MTTTKSPLFDGEIARAHAGDLLALIDFNQAMAFETEGRRLDRGTLTHGVKRVLDDDTKGFYLVAKRRGRDGARVVVGQLMVTLEWSDWRNGTFWWIQSVYVAPDARGQGVYRALHETVRALAHDDGHVCGLRLYVEHDNTGAQETYRKVGMRASHYRMFEEEPVLPPLTESRS